MQEPDPVQYFMLNHRHCPELQQLDIRNGMHLIPFATKAKSLDKVEYLEIQHFLQVTTILYTRASSTPTGMTECEQNDCGVGS